MAYEQRPHNDRFVGLDVNFGAANSIDAAVFPNAGYIVKAFVQVDADLVTDTLLTAFHGNTPGTSPVTNTLLDLSCTAATLDGAGKVQEFDFLGEGLEEQYAVRVVPDVAMRFTTGAGGTGVGHVVLVVREDGGSDV